MDDLKAIQNEIERLAYEYFRDMDCLEGFSYPLVPRISEEYLKNRFVVMGQETNTWKGHIYAPEVRKDFLEGSLAEYDRFVRDEVAVNYPGEFWQFSKDLYQKEIQILDGDICNGSWLSHCWINLFCMEKCAYRNDRDKTHLPSQNRRLAKRVMEIQKDFVFRILKIIKPKTILAMTYYQNDSFLIENGLGTSFDKVEFCPIDKEKIYSRNHIAEIKINDVNNPLSKTKIIRSYHPKFFTKRINNKNIFKDIGQKLMERFGKTKSQYYREILLDSLKSE